MPNHTTHSVIQHLRRTKPIAKTLVTLLIAGLLLHTITQLSHAQEPPQTSVKPCDDFEINGKGDHQTWNKTPWVKLNRRDNGVLDYTAQFKILYSKTGIYVLFQGSDDTLTATMTEDFSNLWTEDVYECFFWTDERHPLYFEYEISPLNVELPIIIPNIDGRLLGWRPWHYDGDRRTKKMTSAIQGETKSGAKVKGWTAEVFIPYQLFEPLANVPPKPGTRWRANFYRVDYDHDQTTAWDWARVGPSFHDYKNFGTLVFE